jgi:hypothetical protein
MKRGELRTLAAEPWSEHWTWAVDVLIWPLHHCPQNF